MARTKQTARKSTGGLAPRKMVMVSEIQDDVQPVPKKPAPPKVLQKEIKLRNERRERFGSPINININNNSDVDNDSDKRMIKKEEKKKEEKKIQEPSRNVLFFDGKMDDDDFGENNDEISKLKEIFDLGFISDDEYFIRRKEIESRKPWDDAYLCSSSYLSSCRSSTPFNESSSKRKPVFLYSKCEVISLR